MTATAHAAAAPSDRLPALLGVLAGLIVAGGWWYPSGAYPRQSLTIDAALFLFAVALTIAWLRGGTVVRESGWKALRSRPAFAAAAIAAYAYVRWKFAPVPALGREWVVGLQWMAVAAGAGLALGVLPEAARSATALRRILAAFAVVLGLLAVKQYTFDYAAAGVALKAGLNGPVNDLTTQSLLHALAERRVGGPLGDPNLFAALLSVLAVFSIGTLGDRGGRGWRALGAAGWIAAAIGLALTKSRGGALDFLLATAAGLLTLFCSRAKKAGSGEGTKTSAAPAALLAAIAGAWLWLHSAAAWAATGAAPGGWLERLTASDTVRERIFYWEIALRIWFADGWPRFAFGGGPGSFERLYPVFKSPLAHESAYAHSWIFQFGAELGIVGLMLIASLWVGVAADWLRGLRRMRGPLAEAAWPLLAVCVLAFDGLFEFSLQWRPFLVGAGLFAGLGAAFAAQAEGYRPPLNRFLAPVVLLLVAAAGAIALVAGGRFDLATAAHWDARTALDEGRTADAKASLTRALSWTPDNSQYLIELAGTQANSGDAKAAWETLERARESNPVSAAVYAAEAQWNEAAGREDSALSNWAEAVTRYPTKVEYRLSRARLLLRMGRTDGAQADLRAIENGHWPVWEFLRDPYNALRKQAGLEPVAFDP